MTKTAIHTGSFFDFSGAIAVAAHPNCPKQVNKALLTISTLIEVDEKGEVFLKSDAVNPELLSPNNRLGYGEVLELVSDEYSAEVIRATMHWKTRATCVTETVTALYSTKTKEEAQQVLQMHFPSGCFMNELLKEEPPASIEQLWAGFVNLTVRETLEKFDATIAHGKEIYVSSARDAVAKLERQRRHFEQFATRLLMEAMPTTHWCFEFDPKHRRITAHSVELVPPFVPFCELAL